MIKRIHSSFVILLFFYGFSLNAQEIYISTSGSDSNNGSKEKPLATLIAARDKARETGAKTIYIRGGRYNFDETCILGSEDSGVTFSGYQDERVIFDGSKYIQANQFQVVTDEALLSKLHTNAAGKVYSQVIVNPELQSFLEKPTAQISMNDKMATVARFPNIGFAHINRSTVTGEVIGGEGTNDNPKGAEFKLHENINASKWAAELERVKKARIKGYISADWHKEEKVVSTFSASGNIKLRDGSKYGVLDGGAHVNRLFFYHLLCELDEPGEWYYDSSDSRLYVWPTEPITNNSSIGVWAGPQCFEINNGHDIQIKKITIQNIGTGSNGQGAINIIGASKNILVAGVTFRYIAEPLTSVNLWHDVKDSKVLSCNFYDVSNNSRLYGGKYTSTSVEYGNNTIENCHFTQIYSKDFYGKACGINGAGNTFKNNLIHNMNGQPVTHAGIDHIIELNEAFNVGIEEGDGGAFYTGNAMWSFGNQIRHNFVHHIMSVPKLLGRAAFFSDDFDAGEDVYENVVFKGGWEALKMNKGGGHDIVRNVVLACHRGIRNGNSKSSDHEKMMNYLSTNPLSNDKNNYIGRLLKVVGVSGWETTVTTENWADKIENFWFERYPQFEEMILGFKNNQNFYPYASHYDDNMFYANNTNILGGSVETRNGNRDITLDIFENPSVLNFKFKSPKPSFAPNIPFEKIGLYLDQYRCALPNKDVYRKNIREHFSGQPAHDNSAIYDFNTINTRLYYNTGEMIFKLTPCMGAIESPGDDSYNIKVIGETCPDKDNGQIKIEVKESGNYAANINGGANINFTEDLTIQNLVPQTYNLCITNVISNKKQCFEFTLDEATEVTGKTKRKKEGVSVEISHGTPPFNVLVNGKPIFYTNASNFEVNANEGDLIEVKTSVECEGSLSKIVSDVYQVLPNPTNGRFSISMSVPVSNVQVNVYNVYGQSISSKFYEVSQGRIELDITEQPSGVYFAKVDIGKNSKTLKVIKK